ncbi:amidase [Spiribacter halobius]|uniref:Amidase n=1 Tax=Sediminicurvatus halobius TaxID=2182432 RepID=A0A2U2N017_9GAMM|nr:amidase [Spiribacter halobius]PWG62397.1 amidase [Spiribacter halobius]UEX79495.1 amidase [Spiribacter halobius]
MAERIQPADPVTLTAREAARRIGSGALSSRALVEACLERIAREDESLRAWKFVDPEKALAEADERDQRRKRGLPLGSLHGVPVGIKDIIDVQGMPTTNGTAVDEGRRPEADATLVRRLRQAGAVILGKTVTTELAYYQPADTRNPHDPERTPGGSSSGSAAAVAAHMVPLAVGTQTHGSVIRPAAFCGVVGFKPTYGAIPRTGVLRLAPTLDQVGVFARSIEDAALAEVVMGADGSDTDVREYPGPLTGTTLSEPPVAPDLAFTGSPAWDRAEEGTEAAFDELREALGDRIEAMEMPEVFARARGWLDAVMRAEMARNVGHYVDRYPDQMSDKLRELVEEGRGIRAPDYLAARDMSTVLHEGLRPIFHRFDAIVTPAVPGEAPVGLDTTGDPAFCSLWTFCGLPCLSLPLLTGPNGLPLGVQLVGQRGQDARLLRTARWLVRQLTEGEAT